MTVYDPAWDMPRVNWQQQGSFTDGQIPPAVAPDAGTQICIGPIAREWLYVVLGALDQLRNPSTWIVADDDAMNTVLRRVDKLKEIIAVGEGCTLPAMIRLNSSCILQYSNDGGTTWVDATDWALNFPGCVRANIPPVVPVNPPGNPPGQEACNIAWYLAEAILQKALAQRAADRTINNSVSNSVANIINAVFNNNPFIDFLTQAANYLVQTTNPQTAADVTAASTDATLLTALAKAIFDAINVQGYVSAANFSQVATNIAAISYPAHSWVPTMLANFWNNLGLAVIKQMQSEGTVTDGDCSAFDTAWCHYFDFGLNNGGWAAYQGSGSHYSAGQYWVAEQEPGAPDIMRCAIYIDMGHDVHITQIQAFTTSNEGVTHADGEISVGGVQSVLGVTNVQLVELDAPNNAPGYTWISTSGLSATGRYVLVYLSTAFASGTGYLFIAGIQVRGTGVNPFGFGDCVVGP